MQVFSLFINYESIFNMIGLKRGTVKLKKHNPNWLRLFEKEKKLLLKRFPNIILEISHGGSTAIPNIPAKPIIDIFAVVSSLRKTEAMRSKLEKFGYEYRGANGVTERILYVKGKARLRTHHLQFIERRSNEWKNHILIKEYFLKNPDVAKKYADLKIRLAKKYPKNRKKYSHGKNAFITLVIKKAQKDK